MEFRQAYYFYHGVTAPSGPEPFIIEFSRSYSDTPHSIGHLCPSDQSVAGTSTCQHTTLTTDIYDSGGFRTHNPSKQAADPRLRPRGNRDRQGPAGTCSNGCV